MNTENPMMKPHPNNHLCHLHSKFLFVLRNEAPQSQQLHLQLNSTSSYPVVEAAYCKRLGCIVYARDIEISIHSEKVSKVFYLNIPIFCNTFLAGIK